VTFDDQRTLDIGGERISLAWHGPNHTPDNIFIHLPDHDALMLVDVVLPGWVPFGNLNLGEDIPGTIAAPATALRYPWTTFIGGHLGRLGSRRDLQVHQDYLTDLGASVRAAMATVDPTPYFVKYANNPWAALKVYLDKASEVAAAPVVQKYIDILGAADVFTQSSAYTLIESIRLDNGEDVAIHD
jgi:glyoxylase-like metal-dependent hydrolase (beta-lactamase superfamily II)